MSQPRLRETRSRETLSALGEGRPTLREAQRALTRRRIVDAAVELFGGRSALEVTVEDIARSAGVTRPTVYAHYPRMSDIITAILDELYAVGDRIYGQLAELPEWTPATVRAWLDEVAECYQAQAAKLSVTSLPGLAVDRDVSVSRHRGYIERLTAGPRWQTLDDAEAEQRAFMLVLLVESFFMVRVSGAWPLRHSDPIALLADSVFNLLPPAPTAPAPRRRARSTHSKDPHLEKR